MENVYGIGVANRYALFLDEDSDPLDILKQSEAEQKVAKAKKIEDATKPVAKGPAVKKEAANTRNEAGKFSISIHSGSCIATAIENLARAKNGWFSLNMSVPSDHLFLRLTNYFPVHSCLLSAH